ncbi:hypothetical protein [Nesterenkonia sandarakina]|uniref:Uncharacterized protein n=1 Tax=Nesterenkonia sandarakina TaxID=272918 RepID=A0A7Z0E9E1_9MICC|nr:hypothetical protein [Nesterenkonia sandarakina]NYJ17475.1 hypothetical protein [Nesterenkonia sandarakina]
MHRSEALASLTALAAGVCATALTWQVGAWWPQGYGLAYAVSASVGALTGLVAFNVYPRRTWNSAPGTRTHAELVPRGPGSFARQWVFALPLATAFTLILGLVLAGLHSSTDENGLHRLYQRRELSGWGVEDGQIVDVQYGLSSSGPFPGWYYGVPVLVGTVLLIIVVYWSLRRIAAAPRPTSPALYDADTALRSRRTVFVMATSSAALAFQVAGLLAIGGTVLRASHLDAVPTTDTLATVDSVPVEPGHTLALIAILASLVVAAAAVVLFAKGLTVVAALWSTGKASRRPEDAPVP